MDTVMPTVTPAQRQTWDRIDVPLLEWLADHPDVRAIEPTPVAAELGADVADVRRSLDRMDGIFYEGKSMFGGESGTRMMPRLTERGLRAAGVWPSDDPFAALVTAIEARIAATPDDADRSKLESIRDGLVGAGRDVMVGVLTAYVKGQAGLA
jgi:hypothetical protein